MNSREMAPLLWLQEVLRHLEKDPVVREVIDIKTEEIGPQVYRFKVSAPPPVVQRCSRVPVQLWVAGLWGSSAHRPSSQAAVSCPFPTCITPAG